MLFGTRTLAEVVSYKIAHSKLPIGGSIIGGPPPDYTHKCAVFQFRAGKAVIRMNGPQWINYDLGEKRKVIYDAKNPLKCIMPNIPYLYGFRRCILPILLLLVWIAIFTSFKPPKSYIKLKLPEKSNHV